MLRTMVKWVNVIDWALRLFDRSEGREVRVTCFVVYLGAYSVSTLRSVGCYDNRRMMNWKRIWMEAIVACTWRD
jgi:hypothetical protein